MTLTFNGHSAQRALFTGRIVDHKLVSATVKRLHAIDDQFSGAVGKYLDPRVLVGNDLLPVLVPRYFGHRATVDLRLQLQATTFVHLGRFRQKIDERWSDQLYEKIARGLGASVNVARSTRNFSNVARAERGDGTNAFHVITVLLDHDFVSIVLSYLLVTSQPFQIWPGNTAATNLELHVAAIFAFNWLFRQNLGEDWRLTLKRMK